MCVVPRIVPTAIVPIPCGRTDAKAVCVLITAMPPGVMAFEVLIMIPILTNMDGIPGVIPFGRTGNAIPNFYHGRRSATPRGIVRKDMNAMNLVQEEKEEELIAAEKFVLAAEEDEEDDD